MGAALLKVPDKLCAVRLPLLSVYVAGGLIL